MTKTAKQQAAAAIAKARQAGTTRKVDGGWMCMTFDRRGRAIACFVPAK